MKNSLWLLFIVTSLKCVKSQISIVESGPGVVKPTETLQLSCKVTGASLSDSSKIWAIHWIRRTAQKQLEWLGRVRYDETKNLNPSVQGRLTLSRDVNKGEVYLSLTGVTIEETGTYYAAKESQHNIFIGDMYKKFMGY